VPGPQLGYAAREVTANRHSNCILYFQTTSCIVYSRSDDRLRTVLRHSVNQHNNLSASLPEAMLIGQTANSQRQHRRQPCAPSPTVMAGDLNAHTLPTSQIGKIYRLPNQQRQRQRPKMFNFVDMPRRTMQYILHKYRLTLNNDCTI